jgi:hypothetical protein
MRQAKTSRAAAWLVLAIAAGSTGTGCTHNYYYGNAIPICPEAATTVNSLGQVCEVPAPGVVGGMVAQGGTTTVVPAAPYASRVVVSQPLDGGIPILGGRRFAWRRTDPEESVATRVEGQITDDSVSRR